MPDATFNYIAPPAERPRSYLFDPPEGTPWRNYETAVVQVKVEDGRALAEALSLDTAGLALVSHETRVENLYDSPTVREHYYPEMEALVQRVTGAKRVHAFDHNLRAASAGTSDQQSSEQEDRPRVAQEEEDPGAENKQSPVWFAHNDYTLLSGPQRLHEVLPDEAGTLEKRRFAIVNVWKPLRGPVQDVPLAVLDASSIGEGDLVAGDLVYPDRTGEVYLLKPNPTHRWIYFSQMRADEALLFKCYDSDAECVPFTAHSAFDDPTCPEGVLPRESLEVRTFAFF